MQSLGDAITRDAITRDAITRDAIFSLSSLSIESLVIESLGIQFIGIQSPCHLSNVTLSVAVLMNQNEIFYSLKISKKT
jgi:hypothetical protein